MAQQNTSFEFLTDVSDDYLSLILGWEDPFPKPVLELHEGVYVVRDDLLQAGTKVRGADYLIGHCPKHRHVQEWVYGSCPATGYAQISLPFLCNKYNKKAVIFMAARSMSNLHEYQKRGLELGVDYRWIKDGMLNVTQKRARDYVAEDPTKRALLPIGLEHPTVFACFIKVARSLPIVPKHVWSVGSSGTLSRALQLAWPNAEVHVVSSGGHNMSTREIGRAIFHPSKYKWNQTVKKSELPPFPSAPEYDAKAWMPMLNYYESNPRVEPILFWNVGA